MKGKSDKKRIKKNAMWRKRKHHVVVERHYREKGQNGYMLQDECASNALLYYQGIVLVYLVLSPVDHRGHIEANVACGLLVNGSMTFVTFVTVLHNKGSK